MESKRNMYGRRRLHFPQRRKQAWKRHPLPVLFRNHRRDTVERLLRKVEPPEESPQQKIPKTVQGLPHRKLHEPVVWILGILPCVRSTCRNRVAVTVTSALSYIERSRLSRTKSKKDGKLGKGSSSHCEGVKKLGCAFQDFEPPAIMCILCKSRKSSSPSYRPRYTPEALRSV